MDILLVDPDNKGVLHLRMKIRTRGISILQKGDVDDIFIERRTGFEAAFDQVAARVQMSAQQLLEFLNETVDDYLALQKKGAT